MPRTNRTPETKKAPARREAWKANFISALENGATVTAAANASNVGRSTVYDARISDPAFAEEWDNVQQDLLERVEQALYRNALGGDTTALIFIAKAKLKWSDRPQPDEQLQLHVEAMRRAIAELDPQAQAKLLEAYERQMAAQKALTPRAL